MHIPNNCSVWDKKDKMPKCKGQSPPTLSIGPNGGHLVVAIGALPISSLVLHCSVRILIPQGFLSAAERCLGISSICPTASPQPMSAKNWCVNPSGHFLFGFGDFEVHMLTDSLCFQMVPCSSYSPQRSGLSGIIFQVPSFCLTSPLFFQCFLGTPSPKVLYT